MRERSLDFDAIIRWSKAHSRTHGIHGERHWRRVEAFGMYICDMLDVADCPKPNRDVVRLFALLHDSCRLDDGHDEYHGPRAAKAIEELRDTLLAPLSDDEFSLLQTAIGFHTSARTHDDVTVCTCFDSDRLDLGRVHIRPAPHRMCTYPAACLAEHGITFASLE